MNPLKRRLYQALDAAVCCTDCGRDTTNPGGLCDHCRPCSDAPTEDRSPHDDFASPLDLWTDDPEDDDDDDL